MYESQFQLKRRPFAATPDPTCFLSADPFQAALDQLVVCVEQGHGVAVVSAPAGNGKTLLCERLRTELEGHFEIVFLHHASFLTRRALLQSILADLNHAYQRQDEQELRLELVPAIRRLNPSREGLVLICDEAHDLNEDLLEELRILSDLAERGRPLVRLVLVGQPGLEETLALPGMEALNQRIRAHICLEPFDRVTSLDYIDYRITWAGGRTQEIFTPAALELICSASQGIPRCINQLCDHSLLLGYVAEERPVDVETIRQALQDLRQLPLHWDERISVSHDPRPTEAIESVVETRPEPARLESASSQSRLGVQYQSVEFGADLPAEDAAIEDCLVIEAEAINEASFEPAEEEPEVAPIEDHASHTRTFMTGRPLAIDVPSPPPLSQRALEPTEEIVWDRYAAIDGGFPIPDGAASDRKLNFRTSEMEVEWRGDTESHRQVQPILTSPVRDSGLMTEEDADGFEAVCARLEGMLPDVDETESWTAADHAIDESVQDPISPNAAAADVVDEWDSIEAELGMAVCDLANQLQTEMGPGAMVDDSADRLHEILSPSTRTSVVESTVTEPVMAPKGQEAPARPYRNLFSQLRRKQQGMQ